MTEYFEESRLERAKKQKSRTLTAYFITLAVFLAFSVLCIVYYRTFPYSGYRDTASKITALKAVHYSVTGIFVVFSFVFLGIKYRRVNRYYRLCFNLKIGLRETSTGSFLEYDESVQDKDGVDMKSLVFIEWNKYKNDYFERKVLVFYESPFPEFKEKTTVRYVTQGNVLVSYEILD